MLSFKLFPIPASPGALSIYDWFSSMDSSYFPFQPVLLVQNSWCNVNLGLVFFNGLKFSHSSQSNWYKITWCTVNLALLSFKWTEVISHFNQSSWYKISGALYNKDWFSSMDSSYFPFQPILPVQNSWCTFNLGLLSFNGLKFSHSSQSFWYHTPGVFFI